MDPNEVPVNRRPSEDVQPLRQPTVSSSVAPIQVEPTTATTNGRLFLFQYVTMLLSGLILLMLASLAGSSLLNHWLGEPNEVAIFNEFVYSFHIYLLISLVLFSGLHIWMRVLTGRIEQEDQPSSSRTFLAVFLTLLAITIVGAFGAIVYIGVDTLLGTGNYSAKSSWLTILDALQVIVLSGLLWWYFKRPRTNAPVFYVAAVGLISVVLTILLIIFPILAKRDAVIDSRTSTDLTTIVAAVSEYSQKNNKLPGALKDLKLDEKVATRISSYEYEVTQSPAKETSPYSEDDYYYDKPTSTKFSYKLCATFKTDTVKKNEDKSIIPLLSSPSELTRHPSGRHCFEQTAYGGDQAGTSPAEPSDLLKSYSSGVLY